MEWNEEQNRLFLNLRWRRRRKGKVQEKSCRPFSSSMKSNSSHRHRRTTRSVRLGRDRHVPRLLPSPYPTLSRSLADRVEKLRGKLIRSFLLPLPALSPLSPSPGCSRCEANVTGKRGGKEREKEKERELRGEGKAHYTTNLFSGRKTAED